MQKDILTRLYDINLAFEKRYVWFVLNILLLAGMPFQGFIQVSPANVTGTNPDIIFCGISFLCFIAFSPLSVAYAVHRHPDLSIKSPSLIRFPLNWWIDPLQCLFFTALSMTIKTLGSVTGYLHYGGFLGYWAMLWNISMSGGLWVGIILVHLIYRKRIETSKVANRC